MADYGINIGVNVQAQSVTRLTNQLKELIAIEKKLKGELKQAGASTEKLNKQLEKNTERQRKNKQAAIDSAKAFATGSAQVRKSSAALAEQSKQLDAYRRGVKFGSGAWADFTRAIVKTDFTRSIIQLRRLNKEAETTAAAFRDMAAGGGRSGAQFAKGQSIQDLLAFKPANTTNALRNYSETLQGVISQVDRGTAEYRELFAAIRRVNEELARPPGIATTQYSAPIGPEPARTGFAASAIQGGRRIAGSPIARSLRNRKLGGAVGGGLIGGAFPALFGQSMQAAALGGIGGAAGGAIGGQFGFALGILGTALGEAVDKQIKFNNALKELNRSFVQAGSETKLFAEDIDRLAKQLKITKEEALELAGAFKFLGDPGLTTKAAALFGSKAVFNRIAGIKDEATFSAAILGIAEDFNDEEAKKLFFQTKGLSFDEKRQAIAVALNRLKKEEVQLTKQEIRARGTTFSRRAFRRGTRGFAVEERTPVTEQEARTITDPRAQLLALLDTDTKTIADPTINLKKRLEIVRGRISAEQELLGLQGKQSRAAKIILTRELARTKANAVATAELEKYGDQEDQNLIKAREFGEIQAANLKFERDALELAERSLERTKNIARPLQDQLDAIKDKAAFEREYGELIRSGVIPAVAQQTVQINKQVKEIDRLKEKQSDELDFHILNLEALKGKAETSELEAKIQAKINQLLERRLELEGKAEQAKGAARDAAKTPADRIQAEMDRVQAILNDLVDPANQVILAAQAIGDAFSESFKGLIAGSMSAQEALANLFSRTADHFADMAAQMIAHAIKMQVLGIALNMFGSAASAGAAANGAAAAPASKAGTLTTGPLPNLGSGPSFGSVSDFAPATILPAQRFAQGGFVSGPTNALIGEGGESEYVVPASKMNEAMGRYARGARGAAVIPDGSGGDAGGEMGGGGGSIDVTYSVERINNVNYVTAAEFERGMAQAAKRGAEMGKRGVYSDLVNKRSIRSRVGI